MTNKNDRMKILPIVITWASVKDYLLIGLGTFLQALSLRIFLVPAQLVVGGVSGIAQIVNHYSGLPIGVMTLLGNIPLFILGWRHLGGPRFALRTAFAVVSFSFFTDILMLFLPTGGITSDLLLNTLYGAVISGIGYGIVYRGKGTSGGSDILARILNHWRGISLSQSYLLVDTLVILAAGFTFSWEKALYALVMLYISGLAAETATEGSGVTRTVLVITDKPKKIAEAIFEVLERGVTEITARGAYTGTQRTLLYCVISRSEVTQIKTLITEIDDTAFIVIGYAHEALGEGFKEIGRQ
ncbi:MAG: YitT family protein [Anaerolineales bacterium]|nr:YitT family protein [Anaerolineales bacterium]